MKATRGDRAPLKRARPAAPGRTRLLLVGWQEMLLKAMRRLLEDLEDVEVVGEADLGKDAAAKARKVKPQIVLLCGDPESLPPWLDGVRSIKSARPGARLIFLASSPSTTVLTGAFEHGVDACVHMSSSIDVMRVAIGEVLEGHYYVSPRLTDVLVQWCLEQSRREGHRTPEVAAPRLSPRERDVVGLLTEGLPTKGVAHRLGISVKTVETHRRRAMLKLGVGSIAELTKYAIRKGLTSVGD